MPKPIYETIQTVLDERSLKIADIARMCDLPDSTVRGIISRKQKKVALDVAFRLADGLGISLESLGGSAADSADADSSVPVFSAHELSHLSRYRSLDTHGKEVVDNVMQLELKRIEGVRKENSMRVEFSREITPAKHKRGRVASRTLPIVGFTSAGIPDPTVDMDAEQISADDAPASASIGYRVNGESMEPDYPNNSIVWVNTNAEVLSGDIGVFIVDGGITCKMLEIESGRASLVSINDEYEDIMITEFTDFRTVGKVVN